MGSELIVHGKGETRRTFFEFFENRYDSLNEEGILVSAKLDVFEIVDSDMFFKKKS